MKKPKTSTQEVLFHLIHHGHASIMDFPWLSGFRTRISEFKTRYDLFLKHENKMSKNKFGNTYIYVIHFLPKDQKEKAKKLYENLQTLKK